jgi:EpsD family peptidyl-prolyl cis-trans isomerase
MRTFSRTLVVAACSAVLLAACSGKSGSSSASLVAVKVNSDEVSVPQVNAQLSRMQGVPASQADAARKQVVDGLIDQRLLVQQAIEMKLDRDPEVLGNLEGAKAQVLAQSYLQKTVAPKAKPDAAAIAKYYGEHPELFAQRRVYKLQEVATDLPQARLPELEKVVAGAKSLSDVVNWLRQQDAKVSTNAAVRGAEMLPLAALPRISAMKDGEIGVIAAGNQLTVLQIAASQSQPMNEAQAKPYIDQFLSAIKRDELVKAELVRLRGVAKIEYVGDFAKLDGKLGGNVDAKAAAPAPAADAKTTAPAASNAVEKGLSGLR